MKAPITARVLPKLERLRNIPTKSEESSEKKK
jgi:hypothetical protein